VRVAVVVVLAGAVPARLRRQQQQQGEHTLTAAVFQSQGTAGQRLRSPIHVSTAAAVA
jgi:hypothetical protein